MVLGGGEPSVEQQSWPTATSLWFSNMGNPHMFYTRLTSPRLQAPMF